MAFEINNNAVVFKALSYVHMFKSSHCLPIFPLSSKPLNHTVLISESKNKAILGRPAFGSGKWVLMKSLERLGRKQAPGCASRVSPKPHLELLPPSGSRLTSPKLGRTQGLASTATGWIESRAVPATWIHMPCLSSARKQVAGHGELSYVKMRERKVLCRHCQDRPSVGPPVLSPPLSPTVYLFTSRGV